MLLALTTAGEEVKALRHWMPFCSWSWTRRAGKMARSKDRGCRLWPTGARRLLWTESPLWWQEARYIQDYF